MNVAAVTIMLCLILIICFSVTSSRYFERDGYQFPSQVNTQHAVSSVLLQEKGKMKMKDLREGWSHDAQPAEFQFCSKLLELIVPQDQFAYIFTFQLPLNINRMYCRDMANPNNYENQVFENIDFVVVYYCFPWEQPNHFFSFALKLLTVRQ